MGQRIGMMLQEGSGLSRDVYDGFSWPALFFGPFWYLAKGMHGMGIFLLILNLCTVGATWLLGLLIVPFIANRQYREHLASRGYRTT